MGGIERDLHWPWLGFALDQALSRALFDAKDVIAHATPEVLVSQLPHEVMIDLLSRSLSTERLSASSILESAPPEVLAEHLEPEVMWRCLKDIAKRAGLSERGAGRSESGRRWLAEVLQRALESELLTPADVMRHLPPSEFVRDTPLPVMAELIKNGLVREKFDPALVLQHLTPSVIAENLESSLVWACLTEAATRRFELGEHTAPIPKKTVVIDKPKAAALAARIEPVAPKRAPAKSDPKIPTHDWAMSDDLDVVEENPLPPPPVARPRDVKM